jgi:hypothetical protein
VSTDQKEGDAHVTATRILWEHRIQRDRVGDCRGTLHLAGTPRSTTLGGLATAAHPAQLPLPRNGIPGPGRRIPDLPRAFATAAAFGDIVAAALAVLSLLSLQSAPGLLVAWIFNVWGSVDLMNAFYQANATGLSPGQLGATYFIPTLIVPLLLITHGLVFRVLLQHQQAPAMAQSRGQRSEIGGEYV